MQELLVRFEPPDIYGIPQSVKMPSQPVSLPTSLNDSASHGSAFHSLSEQYNLLKFQYIPQFIYLMSPYECHNKVYYILGSCTMGTQGFCLETRFRGGGGQT